MPLRPLFNLQFIWTTLQNSEEERTSGGNETESAI
jgi:hypothetical protein